MKRVWARAKTHQQHKPGQMNKTESAYAEHLRGEQSAGRIACWWFESVKVRIAYDSCWLTVDFMVQLPDGTLEFHDCKGGPTEGDAAIKQKVMADLFPFRLIEVRNSRSGWVVTEISKGEMT
jgi:hypothetical protein